MKGLTITRWKEMKDLTKDKKRKSKGKEKGKKEGCCSAYVQVIKSWLGKKWEANKRTCGKTDKIPPDAPKSLHPSLSSLCRPFLGIVLASLSEGVSVPLSHTVEFLKNEIPRRNLNKIASGAWTMPWEGHFKHKNMSRLPERIWCLTSVRLVYHLFLRSLESVSSSLSRPKKITFIRLRSLRNTCNR